MYIAGGHHSFHRPLPLERMTLDSVFASAMQDAKVIRERLEQMRGQFLQWGTPELQVFVITKDELRGWIRALEWVLRQRPQAGTVRTFVPPGPAESLTERNP